MAYIEQYLKTGTSTLVAGTVTVATADITVNSTILVSRNTPGGTPGHLYVSEASKAPGSPGSFTISSSSGTDTSTVNWLVID